MQTALKVGQNVKKALGIEGTVPRKAGLSDNICEEIKLKPTVEPSITQNEACQWKMTSEQLASTIALSAKADAIFCGRS